MKLYLDLLPELQKKLRKNIKTWNWPQRSILHENTLNVYANYSSSELIKDNLIDVISSTYYNVKSI